MDATEDWEQHFLTRSTYKRNAESIGKRHGIVIIHKGDFDKQKNCIQGRVISEQESNIERSQQALKHEENPTSPSDIELSSIPTQPEGVNSLDNKEGIITKRKRGSSPTAKELTRIKKRDIFSE